MNQTSQVNTQEPTNELNLADIWIICTRYKLIILMVTILGLSIGGISATFLPTYYVSDMLIKPRSEDRSGIPSSGLASLGALTGGLINSGGGENDALLMHITSRTFILSFIEKNNLSAQIYATKGWDPKTSELIFDTDIYDPIHKKWIDHSAKPKPIIVYKKFMKDFFSIQPDIKNNTLILQIQYYDPSLAYKWLQDLSKEINNYLKTRSQITTNKRLSYLYKTLDATSNNTMKNLIGDLIKEQMRSLMMTSFNEGFAFEVIDPPMLANRPASSKIPLFIFLGGILGFITAIFGVLFLSMTRKKIS
ncbi:hypothetical protein [Paremcibacter congregatus]|uniref:Polysaccharide chain length determinant N-terminal domain-containing protein n=1 Tax=Paremcibacter congregatus TaxID=2043170 RepID=A0A2G4YR95_9PROT|nr:hypothetical protein [Paremcibacter congregatus]PHZ84843.1 hypothetical protein CRD36_08940 [Paremcibacter congregatus]QDE26184.1 hypothetical protein FIV45_02205 [Paremcibacter congregatus]